MTRVGLIAATVLALGLAAEVSAQSSGLTSLTRRDAVLGWEAVGRVDVDNSGFCTGTLIAPDLVLTAAHCVYESRSDRAVAPDRITFRAGLSNGEAIAERRVVQIAAHKGYDPADRLTHSNVQHDVALMRLDAPISTTDADPFAVHSGLRVADHVSVVSYGRGRSDALSRQRKCSILGQRGGVMAFDCNVTFGSSGAPVFAKVGGRGRIVSVISGMGKMQGRDVAFGMRLPEVISELKRDLRSTATRPVAGVKTVRVGSGMRSGGAKFVKP